MPGRIGSYLRTNALALVALTVALGMGTAWASGLAPNSVYSRHIKDGQVRAQDIAAGAVNTKKLAAGAVVAGKIAPDAVSSTQIADGTVDRTDLAPSALAGIDAATLAGLAPDAFLKADQRAVDAARLGGRLPAAYLLATGKSADSDSIDGLDSTQLTTGKARSSSGMVWAPSYRTDHFDIPSRDGAFARIDAVCSASGVQYVLVNLAGSDLHVYELATRKPPDDWLTPTVEVYYVHSGASAGGAWGAMPSQVVRFVVAQESSGRVATIDAAGNMAAGNCFHTYGAVVHG